MFGFGQLIEILKKDPKKIVSQRERIHVSLRQLRVYLQATSYILSLSEILRRLVQALRRAVSISVEQRL